MHFRKKESFIFTICSVCRLVVVRFIASELSSELAICDTFTIFCVSDCCFSMKARPSQASHVKGEGEGEGRQKGYEDWMGHIPIYDAFHENCTASWANRYIPSPRLSLFVFLGRGVRVGQSGMMGWMDAMHNDIAEPMPGMPVPS